MKTGPIIIIDDDEDDKEILEEILREFDLKNKLVWFNNCKDAYGYLKSTSEQPFLIFSDVNLPGLTGFDFKKQIDEDIELRKKSIPFLFYTTGVTQDTVNKAYTEMTVQGFFKKENTYEAIKKDIKVILDYWENCRHPNY
jgi:two-component SAPR family response regulator